METLLHDVKEYKVVIGLMAIAIVYLVREKNHHKKRSEKLEDEFSLIKREDSELMGGFKELIRELRDEIKYLRDDIKRL